MRILLACMTALLLTAAAHAEGVDDWAPRYQTAPQPAAPDYKTHSVYIGGVGGYAWTPDVADNPLCADACDNTWHGGVVGGYLWRPSAMLGLGVEADYVLRDLGDIDVEDGVASLRARAGVFLDRKTFLYATGGVSQVMGGVPVIVDGVDDDVLDPDDYSRGLVVGGGIERDATDHIAVRAEVLHYRHADSYTEWGDHGSTAVRAGLLFKF